MRGFARWAWVAVVLAALPVRAETFKFDAAKLTIEAPEGWKCEIENNVLHMTQPDQHVAIAAFSVDEADLDAALHDLGKELGSVIKDATVEGEGTHADINGLHCELAHGKGTVNDNEVEWGVCIVGAEHPVIFVGFGVKDAFDAHADEIHTMFESLHAEQ
jgi:hypothetical protein